MKEFLKAQPWWLLPMVILALGILVYDIVTGNWVGVAFMLAGAGLGYLLR